MANLEKVVYLTEAQKETLFTNGTLTANGNTINYSDNNLYITPEEDQVVYENKAAASGGTDVSLVTTGEKYIWNNKGTYTKPSGGIPKSDLAPDAESVKYLSNITSIRASYVGASGETPRYIPGKWHANTGHNPENGDIYVFQVPSVGTNSGIYLSVNGTADSDYHPLILHDTTIMTTHFAVNHSIMVIYEPNSTASVYALEPTTNNKETVTGIFKVLNWSETYNLRTYCSGTNVNLPILGGTLNSSMGVPSLPNGTFSILYGAVPTPAERPIMNLSTGVIRVPSGIELGTFPAKTGKLSFYKNSLGVVTISPGTTSGDIDLTLPSTTGILALTSDIKTPQIRNIIMSTSWSGNGPYTQTVTISNYTITANSKVDLQPDATVISQMIADNVQALYIDNNNGTLTAYAVGAAPTAALTVQCTITEVDI